MTLIWLGVLLVFGGMLHMVFQPIWRGRQVVAPSDPATTPWNLRDRRPALGSNRIGPASRWLRLARLSCSPRLPSEFETNFAHALVATRWGLCGGASANPARRQDPGSENSTVDWAGVPDRKGKLAAPDKAVENSLASRSSKPLPIGGAVRCRPPRLACSRSADHPERQPRQPHAGAALRWGGQTAITARGTSQCGGSAGAF
jgi:hypothetical protein